MSLGTWVAQSVKCLTLDFSSGHDLTIHEINPHSRLCADSGKPHARVKLTNREIVTWAEVRCSTDWATQVPIIIFLKMFIYLFWERHSVCVCMHVCEWGRGRERASPNGIRAVSTESIMGLDLRNCEFMTWAENKSLVLNRLSHPGAPLLTF